MRIAASGLYMVGGRMGGWERVISYIILLHAARTAIVTVLLPPQHGHAPVPAQNSPAKPCGYLLHPYERMGGDGRYINGRRYPWIAEIHFSGLAICAKPTAKRYSYLRSSVCICSSLP